MIPYIGICLWKFRLVSNLVWLGTDGRQKKPKYLLQNQTTHLQTRFSIEYVLPPISISRCLVFSRYSIAKKDPIVL